MRTTTIFAQTHTSERTMSPTGLLILLFSDTRQVFPKDTQKYDYTTAGAAATTNTCMVLPLPLLQLLIILPPAAKYVFYKYEKPQFRNFHYIP